VPAIHCRGLIKRYGDVVAVAGLDLTVETGECFGLLGPNGAGKTTCIEILEGLTVPDSGAVEVLGRSPTTRGARAAGLGIRPGNGWPTSSPSRRPFHRSNYRRRTRWTKCSAELEEKRRARVSTLSGGQKQRLSVACALVSRPDLLFLDEPTTGLDPQSRRQLWEVVTRFRAAGGTVLLTTHYMEEAERLCDRVAIMDRGRIIAQGAPSALIATLDAEHIVEFALAAGAPAPGVDELGRLPGVRAVRPGPDRTALTVGEVHRAVPALLALVEQHGAELSMLTTHHATLEDVFMSLTGRQLRDA
jgi:ABC-2 type transport system ATP-binding protein